MNENPSATDDRHRQTHELLPWFLNGTLDESETAQVKAHLAQCAECREELAFEQRIGAEMPECPPALDAETGWAAMLHRLKAPSAPASETPAPASDGNVVAFRSRAFLRRSVPLGWAVAAQAAAIVLMVGIYHVRTPNSPSEAEYHTLASPSASGPGNMLAMFRPDLREADLRRILLANRAELVGGPNVSGAYLLRVDPKTIDATLSRMRLDPQVTMAQPIDEGGK